MRAILLDPNVFTGCRFQHPNRQTFCWKGARPKTVGPLSGALWGAASLSAAALRQHSCRASFLPMAKARGIQRPDLVSVSSSTRPDASLPPLSLLWPDGSAGTGMEQLSATAADDLNVIELVQAMVGGEGPPNRLRQRERFARQVLSQLGPRLGRRRAYANADSGRRCPDAGASLSRCRHSVDPSRTCARWCVAGALQAGVNQSWCRT